MDTFLACSGFKLKVSIKSSRVSSESIAPSRPFSRNVGARWPKKRSCKNGATSASDHDPASSTETGGCWGVVAAEVGATQLMRKAMGTALDHWLGNCNGLCEVEDKPALEHHLHTTLLQNFLPFNSVRSAGRVVMNTGILCIPPVARKFVLQARYYGALSNYSSCRA